MTLADWCLPAAVLLAYVPIAIAKGSGAKTYDNANPRDPGFYADAFRRRALGAHQNGLEAFPLFAAAVLLAEFRATPQGLVDALALAYVTIRIFYLGCYLGDRPTARTLVWTGGFVLNLALFLLPIGN